MNYFWRLFSTILLAGIIGWEREKTHQPAGIRTICFVALSACLAVIFTEEMGLTTEWRFDSMRLISYLIAALGFVGRGCITKDEGDVHGLTTAALLLPVAFIGLFCGLGQFFLAWLTTIFVFVGLISNTFTKK